MRTYVSYVVVFLWGMFFCHSLPVMWQEFLETMPSSHVEFDFGESEPPVVDLRMATPVDLPRKPEQSASRLDANEMPPIWEPKAFPFNDNEVDGKIEFEIEKFLKERENVPQQKPELKIKAPNRLQLKGPKLWI